MSGHADGGAGGALPPAPSAAGGAGQKEYVTTEVIQAFLDENQNLILTILENQNMGKLEQCAQLQARLQQNLMYLAAIADAQPIGAAGLPAGGGAR